jgi:hypothetical protein
MYEKLIDKSHLMQVYFHVFWGFWGVWGGLWLCFDYFWKFLNFYARFLGFKLLRNLQNWVKSATSLPKPQEIPILSLPLWPLYFFYDYTRLMYHRIICKKNKKNIEENIWKNTKKYMRGPRTSLNVEKI